MNPPVRRITTRRWRTGQWFLAPPIVGGVIAGIATGAIGGRFEAVAAATFMAVLTLIVATVELVHTGRRYEV